MEKSQNYVELWGTAGAAPSFSHENHGESFYRFPLRVERLSGQSDLPLILAPSTLLEGTDIAEGTPLRVTGQLRSFNNRSGHGSRLVISTFAQSIEPCDGGHFNRILLSGVLCKQPTLRRTPLGRSICDMILAVNRRYGRADYLPCIAWGKVAAKIAEMQVGDRLRGYVTKITDDHRGAHRLRGIGDAAAGRRGNRADLKSGGTLRVPRFLCLLTRRAGSCTALRALQDASPVGLYAFFITVFDLFRLFMNASLYIFSV